MNFSTILFNNNLLARRHPGNGMNPVYIFYLIVYSRIFFFSLPLFLRPFLIYTYTIKISFQM